MRGRNDMLAPTDPRCVERILHRALARVPDGKNVKHGLRTVHAGLKREFSALETVAVLLCNGAPACIPALQVRELDVQDGSLQRVEPVVVSDFRKDVGLILAVMAQGAHALREL